MLQQMHFLGEGEEEGIALAITTVIPTWIQEVVESYKGDQHYEKMINELTPQPTTQGHHFYGNELLRYKGKLNIGEMG